MLTPRISVAQGSLTAGDETVLVNASNTNVALGSGVSSAIREACGAGFQAHIAELLRTRFGGPMAPGDVLVTDAGAHPRARWVAHVAVMDYRAGSGARALPTHDVIARGCANLWAALEELPIGVSVAMPALGAGVGRLGARDSTRIACQSLQDHLHTRPTSRIDAVTFYGYLLHEYIAIADVVGSSFAGVDLPEHVREHLEATRREP